MRNIQRIRLTENVNSVVKGTVLFRFPLSKCDKQVSWDSKPKACVQKITKPKAREMWKYRRYALPGPTKTVSSL